MHKRSTIPKGDQVGLFLLGFRSELGTFKGGVRP
jgi:hypothetical protein